MRYGSVFALFALCLGGSIALAQRRTEVPDAGAAPPVCAPRVALPGEDIDAAVACAPSARAASGAPVGPRVEALETDGATRATAPGDAAERPRDPCEEVLHAVQFEDVSGAEQAWERCRARLLPAGRIPLADDVRTLEDVTEALHGLRQDNGNFCVAPGAPFDFTGLTTGVNETRGCFVALDRLLTNEDAVLRFVLDDPYAAGRLAARGGLDVVTARRVRRRPTQGTPQDRELVSIARLVGRHFMRVCRCLPGPQPESVTAVRAMHLPSSVETVLVRGLSERGDDPGGT